MVSESGRYCIAFNGEIYNFLESRTRLVKLDHQFRGHSDTEVLLAAIDHYGLNRALQLCVGMFAFALWDAQEQVLHLARDRVGEKPLYFGVVDGSLVFASEIKALLQVCNEKCLTLDHRALADYLEFGYISAPLSVFAEIKKIRPGHLLSIPLGGVTSALQIDSLEAAQVPYWTFRSNSVDLIDQDISDEEAIQQFEALVTGVISEQTISDVPLGAFLSGGIDSSLVCAAFQAHSSVPIKTFTIGFKDPTYDEALQARSIAEHIGSDHTEVYVTAQDALATLPAMASIYDEPFADSSQIPTYLVCRLAKSDVKVCLSGDGGDELFGGYNRYLWTSRSLRLFRRMPNWMRSIFADSITAVTPSRWEALGVLVDRIRRRKGPAAVGLKLHKLADLATCDDAQSAYRLLCSYWPTPADVLMGPRVTRQETLPSVSLDNFFRDAMAWDQQWYLPGDNLVKVDRASMAVSLEMRLPLLDQRVLEFSARLPDKMKIRGRTTKWLLRQLLYRYVPHELVDRPKMGFSAPIASWLRDELKSWSLDLLDSSRIRREGLFDADVVARVHQEHLRGSHDHSARLWTLLMFQSWADRWRNGSTDSSKHTDG
jgi:asparagine synthase (glutamine-hydrolysing)